MKATWGQVDGEGRDIFKDPITDTGDKKSAAGLMRVEQTGDGFKMFDRQTPEQEQQGALRTVFENGKLINNVSFASIREKLAG